MRHELEEQRCQRGAEADRERLIAAAETQMKAFKECLARMLSDNCVTVQPFEDTIRERIQNIIVTLHDKTVVRYQILDTVFLSFINIYCSY